MCFLALEYKVVPDYPVVLAANRDEYLDRPSLPVMELRPGVWGGKDAVAGGTWLGINRHGLIVGVANLRSSNPQDPDARSRGLLCLDLLERADPAQCADALKRYVQDAVYNDFNLLVASVTGAWIATWVKPDLRVNRLEPGIHILGNSRPNLLDDPKVSRGRAVIKSTDIDATLLNLQTACRDHGARSDGSDAICIHAARHGTRSSAIIALHYRDPRRHRYLAAEGRPCRSEYQDLSRQIHEKV